MSRYSGNIIIFEKGCFSYMVRIHILLFLGILCITAGMTSAENITGDSGITVVGEEYAPFSYLADGRACGQAVDLIENISVEAGVQIDQGAITLLPWDKAYNATKTGPKTLLLALYRTPARENDFRWVGPYANDSSAFFVNSASNIKITTPQDLKDLKVGIVSGDAHYGMLTKYGIPEPNIVTADNVSSLIRMVENGSIDAFFHGERAGQRAIAEMNIDPKAMPVAFRVNDEQVWFGLSPDTPEEIVVALQKALDKRITNISAESA